jgi:hypothetical protein
MAQRRATAAASGEAGRRRQFFPEGIDNRTGETKSISLAILQIDSMWVTISLKSIEFLVQPRIFRF